VRLNKEAMLLWIEAFGVVSAAAFILSAIGNAAMFYFAWKINYFLIASPSDVVMSGFIVISVFILNLLALMILGLLLGLGIRALGVIWERARDFEFEFKNISKVSEKFSSLAAIMTIFTFLFTTVESSQKVGEVLKLLGLERWKEVEAQASAEHKAKTKVLPKVPLKISYPTGLKVATSSNVDPACKKAPVLWLGSSAVVVGCTDGVRIFHKLDNVVTEPL
jgi:hypothetical protein